MIILLTVRAFFPRPIVTRLTLGAFGSIEGMTVVARTKSVRPARTRTRGAPCGDREKGSYAVFFCMGSYP